MKHILIRVILDIADQKQFLVAIKELDRDTVLVPGMFIEWDAPDHFFRNHFIGPLTVTSTERGYECRCTPNLHKMTEEEAIKFAEGGNYNSLQRMNGETLWERRA